VLVVSGSTRAASTNTTPCRGEGAHATLATVLGHVQARVVEDARRHMPGADAITTLLSAAGR
jgi:hypothetical protein